VLCVCVGGVCVGGGRGSAVGVRGAGCVCSVGEGV
jgi:hypothetical protein